MCSSGIALYLKWLAVVVLIAAICIAICYITKQQSMEKQIKETPNSTDNISEKKNTSGDPSSVTNQFDASIYKELRKAYSVMEKGHIEDALRRYVLNTLTNKLQCTCSTCTYLHVYFTHVRMSS